MANITVAVQTVTRAEITPTYQGSLSVSDVYRIANNGRTIIQLKKTGAGACTVTVKTPRQVAGLDVAEDTKVVPATTGDKMFSNLDPSTYNVSGQNYLEITLSEITGLTLAAFQPEE